MRNILILILLLIGLIDAKIYILKGEQREGSLLDNAEIISPSVYIPTKARIIDFYIGNRAGRVSQSYFCIWDKRAQKVVICGGGRYGDIRGVVLEPGEYFVFPSVNTYVNVKLKSEDEDKRGDGSSFNGNNKKTATYILEGEQKEGSFMENAKLNAPVYYIPQTIKIVDYNSYSIDSKESNMPFCIWNKDTQRAVACGGRGYGNIKGTILKPGRYFILPPANVHVKVVAKAVESNNNYPPSKPDNNFNNQGKNGSNSANKEFAYYNFGVREPWFRGWRVYTALEDGKPGKIPESNNRFGWYSGAKDVGHAMPPKKETKGAVLYLHPAFRTTPTILKKRWYVPYNKDLYLRVAGNRNGDWLLEVDVNGKTIFSKVIDGRKWYEIRIPLSKYGGKRVDLAIKVKANGWYFEYAYFDEVALVDSKKIKNNSNNSWNDNGSIMSKMEYGIDRPGMDYSSFTLSVADPKLCEKRCEADIRCRAWTYVKPNTFQGPKPMCWLKDAIPAPVKNKDCISGFKNAHIDIQDMLDNNSFSMSKIEYGIDRPGMDYSSFALSMADPKLCEKRCEADSRCRAWTYVKPNTFQGPKPMCWLKDAIPAPVKNKDCISGFKKEKKTSNLNKECKKLLNQYSMSYNTFFSYINQPNKEKELLDNIKIIRDIQKKLKKCNIKEDPSNNQRLKEDSSSSTCGKEYKKFFVEYQKIINYLKDISVPPNKIIQAKKRYLEAKNNYYNCINSPKQSLNPTITKIVIATKAKSKTQPDKSTITSVIKSNVGSFYAFIYYKNFSNKDVIDTVWKYKPTPNALATIIYTKKGAHVLNSNGVVSVKIGDKNTVFPEGEYIIEFYINGKKAFEKKFKVVK